jgi:hypothetical protein
VPQFFFRHSGQAKRDPESRNKGTGSPPPRGQRLDTGLRRYDHFEIIAVIATQFHAHGRLTVFDRFIQGGMRL